MDTNRLSKKTQTALNTQMTREATASQIYLSYAAWAAAEGYEGVANFLFRHAEEERATWHFMQWFVKEQTEEETLAINLLDKIKIAGGVKASGDALYALDRDLEKKPDDATLAEDKTAAKP